MQINNYVKNGYLITNEVLKENEIFDRILHDERMKKAYIKIESRKRENLIDDRF